MALHACISAFGFHCYDIRMGGIQPLPPSLSHSLFSYMKLDSHLAEHRILPSTKAEFPLAIETILWTHPIIIMLI